MPENYSQSKPTIMKSDDSPVWCGLGTTKFHLKMPMHISEHFLSPQGKICLFFLSFKKDTDFSKIISKTVQTMKIYQRYCPISVTQCHPDREIKDITAKTDV